MPSPPTFSGQVLDSLLGEVESQVAAGKLSRSAADSLGVWLQDEPYRDFAPAIAEHIQNGRWAELETAFWTVLPFGTAGRRGRMYEFGTATINERTIGESTQGLANYLLDADPSARRSCAIGYDTRHRSREFAELCAEIMTAAGFRVYFLNDHRSTPALAFTVASRDCDCGIMITASHNPPSDNAIKIFWRGGVQLRPPEDVQVVAKVQAVEEIKRLGFADGVANGQIEFCEAESDRGYLDAVKKVGHPGPRDLNILYTPLHGVGLTSVLPALTEAGFERVSVFADHAEPDGDFPNVPNRTANPEAPEVFDTPIELAKQTDADLIVASDPDADRLGVAAKVNADGDWRTIDGNQIAALLADYTLDRLQRDGHLTPEHYLVKTIVTTDLLRRIAAGYGVKIYGDIFTGFKWIGGTMDAVGPEMFVLGCEEAHGYLAGTHIRDKDGAVAAVLLAELAAEMKQHGQTLFDRLDQLAEKHGVHLEKTIALTMPGAEGMTRMREIMQQFRDNPPSELAGRRVVRRLDYLAGTAHAIDRPVETLPEPRGDVLVFETDDHGNRIALRPSGTEPKIKFYLFAVERPAADLAASRQAANQRIDALEAEIRLQLAT